MSRSRRDRHKWKRKERQRSDCSDPPKIELHRDRVVERFVKTEEAKDGYMRVVFKVRLVYDRETFETTVFVNGEAVQTLPYLVENVSDVHHLVAEGRSLDLAKEQVALHQHVSRIKATREFACHLELLEGEFRGCQSAFACPHRQWNGEQNMPQCTC